MIRLTDEHWERIRDRFPDERIPDRRPRGENRFRRVACSKQSCGSSTLGRSGTCCRKAILTTKLCIGDFQFWCYSEVLRQVLTDFAKLAYQGRPPGSAGEAATV
jgi:hypothetical protein